MPLAPIHDTRNLSVRLIGVALQGISLSNVKDLR